MLEWKTTAVEKSLGMQVQRNDDGTPIVNAKGKPRMGRKGVTTVPYVYPVISITPNALDPVEEMSIALLDILEAKRPGFDKVSDLVESLNMGLYVTNRNAIARGADVRYTAAQRMLIRNLGNLVKDGLFEREMAITALQRQGVSDSEAAIDAYIADASSNGQ